MLPVWYCVSFLLYQYESKPALAFGFIHFFISLFFNPEHGVLKEAVDAGDAVCQNELLWIFIFQPLYSLSRILTLDLTVKLADYSLSQHNFLGFILSYICRMNILPSTYLILKRVFPTNVPIILFSYHLLCRISVRMKSFKSALTSVSQLYISQVYLLSGFRNNTVLEYVSLENFIKRTSKPPAKVLQLPFHWQGTGHVVDNGFLYCHKADTPNQILKVCGLTLCTRRSQSLLCSCTVFTEYKKEWNKTDELQWFCLATFTKNNH